MLSLRVLLMLTLGTGAPLVRALEADRDQPISIQADTAMIDEHQGRSVYEGNVIITQGTLEVIADEVEIHTAERAIIRIVAGMNEDSEDLARYRQQVNEASDMVYAHARKITYLVQEEQLHLSGRARLQQVEDVFEGELLFYDLARGVANLSSDGESGRVNMTITPEQSR